MSDRDLKEMRLQALAKQWDGWTLGQMMDDILVDDVRIFEESEDFAKRHGLELATAQCLRARKTYIRTQGRRQ